MGLKKSIALTHYPLPITHYAIMPLPKFARKTLSAVLNSPILQVLGMGDVYNVLKEHFALSAQEITLAYQNSYTYALSAIAAGLAQEESWRAFWQKITNSRVESEFSSQVVSIYLEPFAQTQDLQGSALEEFRQQTMTICQALIAQAEELFQPTSFQFTEAELATLIKDTEIATLSDLILEHLQSVPATRALLTESLVQFLAYNNLLGHALLFFLLEELRDNERFQATLTHFQQDNLLGEVQDLQQAQADLQSFLATKLTAIEQQIEAQNQQFARSASPDELTQILSQKQTLLTRQQKETPNIAWLPKKAMSLLLEKPYIVCSVANVPNTTFGKNTYPMMLPAYMN